MKNGNASTENHPTEPTSAPSLKKGEFEQIGAFAPLKNDSNSANQKTGEPWGSGGQ